LDKYFSFFADESMQRAWKNLNTFRLQLPQQRSNQGPTRFMALMHDPNAMDIDHIQGRQAQTEE
jgi:hypothetical protein